jgi:hypothetical protein
MGQESLDRYHELAGDPPALCRCLETLTLEIGIGAQTDVNGVRLFLPPMLLNCLWRDYQYTRLEENTFYLYICVLEVSIFPLSTILLLDFGTVPTVVVFCFSFVLITQLSVNIQLQLRTQSVINGITEMKPYKIPLMRYITRGKY